MSFRFPWPPAYPGVTTLPRDAVTRITVEIPKADADTIISVALQTAILTAVSSYAIKQTAEMIRTKKLTHADQRAFFLHLCQRTYSEFVKETGESNVTGGTAPVCDGVTQPSDTAAGIGKEVKKGGKGQGKGGRGGRG